MSWYIHRGLNHINNPIFRAMSFFNRMASSLEELVLLIKQLVETSKKNTKCICCQNDISLSMSEESGLTREIESLLSRKEVIDLLQIDPSTYSRWKKRGIIQTVTIGGRDYVREADLAEALFESRRKGKI